MDMMYIKYDGVKRKSIIKDGTNIIKNDVVLIKEDLTPSVCSSIIDLESYKTHKENKLDDEISNYFFNEIHKNYLKNR